MTKTVTQFLKQVGVGAHLIPIMATVPGRGHTMMELALMSHRGHGLPAGIEKDENGALRWKRVVEG